MEEHAKGLIGQERVSIMVDILRLVRKNSFGPGLFDYSFILTSLLSPLQDASPTEPCSRHHQSSG